MTRSASLAARYNLPIKEIAHQCGYDDVSNFYRDWRRVYEMTPRRLRVRQLELLCRSEKPLQLEYLGDVVLSLKGSSRE